MSKKHQKRPKSAPPVADAGLRPTDGESRQSEAVTVAWMLALLITLAAELIAIPASFLVKALPQPAGNGLSMAQIADLFLFLALVTGLVTVGLVPLVYRVRAIPPPQSITIAALVAGAVPPIAIVLRWLF